MSDALSKVCSMPNDFMTSANKSMVQLLKDSGYMWHKDEVTQDEIIKFLKAHPDHTESWEGYSADKRSSTGWYLLREGNIWTVGYFNIGGKEREQRFNSSFEACAVFILNELEELAKNTS